MTLAFDLLTSKFNYFIVVAQLHLNYKFHEIPTIDL